MQLYNTSNKIYINISNRHVISIQSWQGSILEGHIPCYLQSGHVIEGQHWIDAKRVCEGCGKEWASDIVANDGAIQLQYILVTDEADAGQSKGLMLGWMPSVIDFILLETWKHEESKVHNTEVFFFVDGME